MSDKPLTVDLIQAENVMQDRASRLIRALAGSIMNAAEGAAREIELASQAAVARMEAQSQIAQERLELAARVASIEARMAAVASVLEAVGAQKARLQSLALKATGAVAVAYTRQIAMLTEQEMAILQQIGVPPAAAQQALAVADAPADPDPTPLVASDIGGPREERNGHRRLKRV